MALWHLQAEGVSRFQPLAPTAFNEQLRETLLCFVLIDAASAHAFCSRYDFGPWPLLPGVDRLTADVHRVSHPRQNLPPAVVLVGASTIEQASPPAYSSTGYDFSRCVYLCWTTRQGLRKGAPSSAAITPQGHDMRQPIQISVIVAIITYCISTPSVGQLTAVY